MRTVEGLVTAVHADMGGDTKQFSICSLALQALEALVRSLRLLVLDENLTVAPSQVLVVFVHVRAGVVLVLHLSGDPAEVVLVPRVDGWLVLGVHHLVGSLLHDVLFFFICLHHNAVFDIPGGKEREQTSSFCVVEASDFPGDLLLWLVKHRDRVPADHRVGQTEVEAWRITCGIAFLLFHGSSLV